MYKKILSAVVSVAFLAASMPAQAAFGRSSSSSSSKSSSYSSPKSSSSSSYKAPSSSRSSSYSNSSSKSSSSSSSSSNKSISGGNSLGMTRSGVTESVRNGSYKQTMPSNNSSAAGSSSSKSQPTTPYSGSYGGNSSGNSGYSNSGYNSNYNSSSYNRSYNNGPRFGVGSLLGAAVAGGLVGYLLHTDSSGNSYFTNPANPGVAYNSSGQVMGSVPSGDYQAVGKVSSEGKVEALNGQSQVSSVSNPVNYSVKQNNDSGFSWFWILFALLVIIGAAYMLFGRNRNSLGNTGLPPLKPNNSFGTFNNLDTGNSMKNNSLGKNPEAQLRDDKETFFLNFQKNNRPSKIDWIRNNTEDLFFDAVKDMVMESDDGRSVMVKKLEAQVVDITAEGSGYVASIYYQGLVYDNNEPTDIDEIWHFVYRNNQWRLAGIEQKNDN